MLRQNSKFMCVCRYECMFSLIIIFFYTPLSRFTSPISPPSLVHSIPPISGLFKLPKQKNIFQNYQRKYDENGKFSSLKAQSSASSPPPKLHLVDYSSEGGVNTQEPIYDVFTNDREEIHHEFEPNSDLEEPTKKKSLITLTHMFKQLIKFLRKKETLRRL